MVPVGTRVTTSKSRAVTLNAVETTSRGIPPVSLCNVIACRVESESGKQNSPFLFVVGVVRAKNRGFVVYGANPSETGYDTRVRKPLGEYPTLFLIR